MNFVLPLRPSRSAKTSKTTNASNKNNTLQPPPESPRRRPSLATRAGIVKRRSSIVTAFNAPSMSLFEAMFGDDFPDAFANGDGRSCKSRKSMLDLPAELLEIVCQSLSKMDIKRLRFTCRELAEKAELRIDRVYISPNRANLDCLNNIINHPRLCLQVQEIVWDDAQLVEYPTIQSFRAALTSDDREARVILEDHLRTPVQSGSDNNAAYAPISVEDCVQEDRGFTELGKAILLNSDDRMSRNLIASSAAMMSVEESYSLYQKLYQDEKEIIKRGWDVSGLQHALTHISNLKRITLTSEVWRSSGSLPTYDTPFLRALPPGFRKPSISPWTEPGFDSVLPNEEITRELRELSTEQHLPVIWRGYSIIMSSLIKDPVPSLEELIVDAGMEADGLPRHLFAERNLDYNNTIRALSTTQLKRLQLPLINYTGSVSIGLLYDLILAMPYLEHLDLMWTTPFPFTADFPEQTYRRLKSIRLHRSEVDGSWLLDLIKRSENLQTVTLDRVKIGPARDPWTGRKLLFTQLREYYATVNCRGPRFTWVELPWWARGRLSIRRQMLDNELDAFLHDGTESPWHEADVAATIEQQSEFKPGFGWIIDGRDPEFRQKRLRQ
ncbi:uncharacterized protein EKO05_0009056 [Ascochyta rabiei]|uniref:uncharacterized protein n=1 Tax=Didymella rabiei TaxID=5454 RepID=UPI00190007FD|nr:uncharacterized protein EKO05_0009056 [Ascochyta rabiei]UPX18765.1 hypothetical protein EKO05_0009056 [Ascochyta rabiei]